MLRLGIIHQQDCDAIFSGGGGEYERAVGAVVGLTLGDWWEVFRLDCLLAAHFGGCGHGQAGAKN